MNGQPARACRPRRHRAWRWLAVSPLLLGLAACQCFTSFTVSGSLAQGVFFRAPADAGPRLGGGRLYHLAVYAAATDGAPLWQVDGVARVQAIRYGVLPDGMRESVRARPLEPGMTYFVGIEGGAAGGPRSACRGKLGFRVGADGAITTNGPDVIACAVQRGRAAPQLG